MFAKRTKDQILKELKALEQEGEKAHFEGYGEGYFMAFRDKKRELERELGELRIKELEASWKGDAA